MGMVFKPFPLIPKESIIISLKDKEYRKQIEI